MSISKNVHISLSELATYKTRASPDFVPTDKAMEDYIGFAINVKQKGTRIRFYWKHEGMYKHLLITEADVAMTDFTVFQGGGAAATANTEFPGQKRTVCVKYGAMSLPPQNEGEEAKIVTPGDIAAHLRKIVWSRIFRIMAEDCVRYMPKETVKCNYGEDFDFKPAPAAKGVPPYKYVLNHPNNIGAMAAMCTETLDEFDPVAGEIAASAFPAIINDYMAKVDASQIFASYARKPTAKKGAGGASSMPKTPFMTRYLPFMDYRSELNREGSVASVQFKNESIPQRQKMLKIMSMSLSQYKPKDEDIAKIVAKRAVFRIYEVFGVAPTCTARHNTFIGTIFWAPEIFLGTGQKVVREVIEIIGMKDARLPGNGGGADTTVDFDAGEDAEEAADAADEPADNVDY